MRQIESNKTDLQKISLKSTTDETGKPDELSSQWNTIPTISEDDRKMLENVKSKFKQKDLSSAKKKESSGDRDKEKERSRKSRSPSRKRDRSRSRSRRYSPERYNRRYRRKNNSRSRSRSRGRYRSRSREIEKPIVPHFSTEFRPRVEKSKALEKVVPKKEEERKKSPKKTTEKLTKKLPIIGKMPVFKKQSVKEDNTAMNNNSKNVSNQQTSLENKNSNVNAEFEDLMPDPVQFASLMAANNNILPPGKYIYIISLNMLIYIFFSKVSMTLKWIITQCLI